MHALPPNIRNRMAKKAAKVARLASARENLESTRASSGSVEVRAAFATIYCAPRASFSLILSLRPLLLRSRDLHVQQAKRTPAARKNRGQNAQGTPKRCLSSSAKRARKSAPCAPPSKRGSTKQKSAPLTSWPSLSASVGYASTSRRSSPMPMCASPNSSARRRRSSGLPSGRKRRNDRPSSEKRRRRRRRHAAENLW